MAKKAKSGISKAQRKALEQREADLMHELENRASKSKGKAAKVAPDIAGAKRKELRTIIDDRDTYPKVLRKAAKAELARRESEAMPEPVKPPKVKPDPEGDKPVKPKGPSAKAKTTAAAERVLAEPGSEGAKAAAKDALEAAEEATDDESDADIKARVQRKRAAREATDTTVTNESGKPLAPDIAGSARADDALPGESEVDYQWRKAGEAAAARGEDVTAKPVKGKGKAKAKHPDDDTADDGEAAAAADKVITDTLEHGEFVAEQVETESGRVFAVGEASDTERVSEEVFGKPSEAGGAPDYETNGNGQYKVKRPSDGKTIGYTRVTTYIATNEDRTLLEKWKMRILLEGVSINDTPDDKGRIDEPVVAIVRDLIHRRDMAIAKARKKDRKGELALGQYGTIVDGAWAEFKRSLDDLGERMLELGGVHVKAAKGTELHELCELYDREGIDAVGALVVEGKITHADLADVEAYARALDAAGIKVLPEYIEQPVVDHEHKIAGRLDRVVLAKMPGSARAARYVLDVKSGRIDLGAGKIAQQLERYARMTPYNLETGETLEPHKASMTKGLVLHLVPGSGVASIHPVDLGLGRVGNDLSAKVRAFRNDGKRAIDTSVDLAAVTA